MTETETLFGKITPRTPLPSFLSYLHHDAPAVGPRSVFGRRLGGGPGDVLDDLVHELARRGGALGVAVAAEGLGYFETLWMR